MPVSVALIGLGYQGRKYIPELIELHQEGTIEFVGVADSDIIKLRPLYLESGVPIIRTTDHMTLLPNVDAAIIATPNSSHFMIAHEWLSLGMHLLIEKPVTTLPALAESLLDIAHDQKVFVMPGHLYRHSRLLKEVKRVIESGELGKMESLNMRWVTPTIPPHSDIRLDLLPHCLDIFHQLFGYMPLPHGSFMASQTRGFFHFVDNEEVTLNVEIAWGLPEKHRSIEICGSQKWLSTDVVQSFQFYYLTDPKTGKREERWVAPNNTLQDQIRYFIRSIAKGPPYDYTLMQAAIEGLKLIEQT